MLGKEVVSTGMAVAVPPVRRISRSTVVMVESRELGSGGKGVVSGAPVDFAETATGGVSRGLEIGGGKGKYRYSR